MPGVRYDHSISFVQKRELPSATITEQSQELVSSCCQNQNPLLSKNNVEVTLINFKTSWQLLYLHWKKNLLAADCQTVRAQWLRSRIALSPWTRRAYEQNIGDSGWEYRFLEWVCLRWCFSFLPWVNHQKCIIWDTGIQGILFIYIVGVCSGSWNGSLLLSKVLVILWLC